MLQFVCHPSLEHLFTTNKDGMSCITFPNCAVFISDYLPIDSQPIHAGLIEATKYRLTHPTQFIYFASFFPKEKLLPLDTFGILSLSGSKFIRLPFHKDQFLVTLEDKQKTEFTLLETDWESFAIKACKELLKEKLSVLKHGGKLDFVNTVSFALRNEAQNCLKNPLRIVELKKLLVSITSFIKKEEIAELIDLSNISKGFADEFLQNVVMFIKGLTNLESIETQQEIDFKLFLLEIDSLNTNSSKILMP